MVQFLPSIHTTSSQRAPWSPAMPALDKSLAAGMSAYDQTAGLPVIAGMDPSVTAGQSAALGIAGQGATGQAAATGVRGVQDILSQGGIGAPMQYGMDAMKGAIGTTQGAIDALNPIASGAFLQSNPYLDQIITQMNESIRNQVNSQFAKSGRYGSGAYAGALGKSLAENESGLRYKNFIDMLNAQLQANQQIGGLAQGIGGMAQGIGGLGQGVAGIGKQGQDTVMQGGAALSDYQAPLYADASKMAEIGGQRMDYEQAKIDAERAGPWDSAMRLAQLAGGIGSLGGTDSSTSIGIGPVQEQKSPSALQTIAGTGLGLLGIGGTIGGFKSMFSPTPGTTAPY